MNSFSPIKVVTLCSGYDAQCLALDRLKRNYPGFDYELVSWAEIDKYAIQAHNALFPQYKDRNMGDITSCDWSKIKDNIDLLTYSTPCQSISSAGKQDGLKKGSGTASSIIWSVLNAIDVLRPKYLLMENVKALVSSKFIGDFHEWQLELVKRGYTNFANVLNSRDFCCPQNRERVFMVSILEENASYHFPEPFPLYKRLKDVLENKVDERYYLSDKMLRYLNTRGGDKQSFVRGKGVVDGNGVATTCTANYYKMLGTATFVMESPIGAAIRSRDIKVCRQGGDVDPQCLTPKRTEYGKKVRREHEQDKFKYKALEPREDGVCNTITSVQKDCLVTEPKILSYTRDANGKVVDRHFKDVANTIHGGTGGGGNTDSFVVELANKVKDAAEKSRGMELGVSISESVVTSYGSVSPTQISARPNMIYNEEYRIRRLTERECFRLMDVDDEDIDKIQAAGISRSQQYKLAGNSIVTNVLFHIFRKLFIDKENENKQLTLF